MASRAPVADIEPRDYRAHLRNKGFVPIVIERTSKRPDDFEFVWQDGDYRAVRVGAHKARTAGEVG